MTRVAMGLEPWEQPTGEIYDVEDLAAKLEVDNRSDEVVESDRVESESEVCDSKRRYTRGLVVAVHIIGVILGIWIDRNAVRAPEYVYGPAPTITVTEHTKEIIHDSTPTVPDSCKEALDLVGEMTPYFETVLGSSGKISDMLSQARIAIASGDHAALIKASNINNTLANDNAKSNNELMDMLSRYKEAMYQCNTDLK